MSNRQKFAAVATTVSLLGFINILPVRTDWYDSQYIDTVVATAANFCMSTCRFLPYKNEGQDDSTSYFYADFLRFDF